MSIIWKEKKIYIKLYYQKQDAAQKGQYKLMQLDPHGLYTQDNKLLGKV